ncbi:Zinc finger CCCH domain-containing protein 18 [Vitis vinifera]|uniref:Zinc finger CCCH domain-containing protein 18 n=1 Tax=Vitis vinifera TaxID=29760 RepID=A0A438CJJ8_VITVI|nr:Zinc finger CCCH domain-containing protein 18 [Vitis vinifera]
MAEEDEKALEEQLENQLEEQRDSLAVLKEALVSDPTNSELLSVHEELIWAIKDAEEGLFHLKRARLLREADSALHDHKYTAEDVKVEPLDPSDAEAEPLEEQSYHVGSKCRFRYTDGRWYNGVILGLEGLDSAKISSFHPHLKICCLCLAQAQIWAKLCSAQAHLKQVKPNYQYYYYYEALVWSFATIGGHLGDGLDYAAFTCPQGMYWTLWWMQSGFKVGGRGGGEQVTFLCWLLMWFEAMSGLKINLEKSEMIPIGEMDNVEDLTCKIGCKVGKLSSSYLVLPLGLLSNWSQFGMG